MPEDSEPPIREFADRGTLWLLESPENLRELLQLAARDIADHLDFSRAERINRSFIPDDLQKQEADLLYRVPFQDGQIDVLVYLLLEHQSRPDASMGFRILSYMVAVWQMQMRGFREAKTPRSLWQLSPIVPMVFYTGKRRWPGKIGLASMMELPEALNSYLPQWETLFLNLQETPAQTLTEADTPTAWILRALQTAKEPAEAWTKVLEQVVRQLDALPETKQAQWRRAMQYLYLLVRHLRDVEEQEDLFAAMDDTVEQHLQEMREVKMTGAQALMEKGRQEGRQEGRKEGLRETLLKLMTRKFGPLDAETTARIRELTEPRLDAAIERILTAQTLQEMEL
jgi:predicted transposase/invertase (TIGR01784 family)